MIRKIAWISLIATLVLVSLSPASHAVLQAVGPTDAVNGFPVWYQDTTGLTLEYCLPRNQVQLDAGVCLILPVAQDPVAGLDLPFVFPTNYPDEAFYWNATAVVDTSLAGDNAVLVLGLEAAFATGPVIPGDQVTFGRLRIVVDAPTAGDYTVTTPYGAYFFPGVAAGKRAIVLPIDIGIGAQGDFTGALGSLIGPFLLASDTEGGTPLPPVTIPLDPTGDLFLSDTALPVFVTGSPGNTNYFEICKTGLPFDVTGTNCVKQPRFSLMGRVFNGTPFVADKSYYIRSAAGVGVVNVYGTTNTSSATAVYEVSGTGLTPATMTRQAVTGDLFAQIPFTAGTTLPASVTITATDTGKTPTAVSSNLTDLVSITKASYDKNTASLVIHASSSDLAVLPALTATGLGTLVNGVLTVSPIVAPPSTVTVTSSQGGSDTAIVIPVDFLPGVIAKQNDFDGDGKTDVAVWRPSDGNWWIIRSSDGVTTATAWGTVGDIPVSGDFDGDGKTDIAVWRASDGNWWVLRSSDGVTAATAWGTGILFPDSDIPVPGDYDGDGKTDYAVWRPSDGNWWVIRSSDGVATATSWGAPTDLPVPGDYDGDGRSDYAVWRPSDGNWWVIRSSDGVATATSWGASTDLPVSGDYDGDGKTDLAVWRPSDGNWWILRSTDGTIAAIPLGTPTDIPVTGDYDGDGRTDLGVWRSADGTWSIIGSALGATLVEPWGATGDIPIGKKP
ncbi:MAG: FG-GAP-like repeat-containing protein [Thermodesulfovibrionales bacterium]